MALFMPTNVIPSSYTKGTVDVNDIMEISWQVNGNSAMTAFQIDFYLNDYASTYVTTTGKQPVDNFYGTDRFGRPEFFTWNSRVSWKEFHPNFTNGKEYKYKITQWYKGENVVVTNAFTTALTGGTKYYFKSDSATISFTAPPNISGASTLYYSLTNSNGWIVKSNEQIISINIIYDESGAIPSDSTELVGTIAKQTLNELFVTQTTSNAFDTQEKPKLTIYRCSTNDYSDQIDLPNNSEIATSIGYFKAVYEQSQDNPIKWIRWQIASANNGEVGDILADTGDIYTPTLNYEYNGFFNGQQYAIQAICESESGQQATTDWILFSINIVRQGEYSGEFTIQCIKKENATLLQWEGVEVIPPTTSPEGYEPQISNGSVTLAPKNQETGEEYSVTWDKQYVYDNDSKESEEVPMNFQEPWTAVWKGNASFKTNLKEQIDFGEKTTINAMVFSPNGKYLAVGVNSLNNHRIVVYKVDNDNFALFQTISTIADVNLIEFAPNNIMFIANGGSKNAVNIYDIQENSIVNKGTIGINETELQINNNIGDSSAKFSPNGKFLVVAQSRYEYNVALFSVNNFDITYLKELKYNNVSLSGANCAAFSLDSNILLIARSQRDSSIGGSVSIFEFANNIYDYKKPLFNSVVDKYYSLAFSPLGNVLAVTRENTSSYIDFFKINENEFIFDHSTTIINNTTGIETHSLTFSNDGNSLMCITNSVAGNGYSINLFAMNGLQDIKLKAVREKSYEHFAQFYPNSKYILTINDSGDLPSNRKDNIAIYNYAKGNGTLLKIRLNNVDLLQLEKKGVPLYIKYNDSIITDSIYVDEFDNVIAIIQQNQAIFNFYNNNELVEKKLVNINYNQQTISSISIIGGNNGIVVDTISIYNNAESSIDIASLYQNPNFEPVWNSEQYKLYMTANFNTNLEGGTGTAVGTGFRVYRQEVGKNVLTPIATIPSITLSVKDYGIVSRKAYKYSLYVYDNNGAFMSAVENEKVVATCFNNFSLLVCDYDETNDEYHVRKQYLFALNFSAGSVGNNNSPTLNANFTRYPTRMPSTQNYASGTLQGLIGAIYTVPALIEQIGNYKYTAKPSTLDYFDNVDLEKELYDLSTAPYQLFLRDMKGRLRMIATNGAISMTTNLKQKQQSINISFPWVEIGDASDVTIIQKPNDYGWNNDNQVLDVSLDVDIATGELSATYPFPYNGTKFYLTGINQELLTAKTPIDVTPAKLNLSTVAAKPNDGVLTAAIKVNREINND